MTYQYMLTAALAPLYLGVPLALLAAVVLLELDWAAEPPSTRPLTVARERFQAERTAARLADSEVVWGILREVTPPAGSVSAHIGRPPMAVAA